MNRSNKRERGTKIGYFYLENRQLTLFIFEVASIIY